MIVNVIFGFLFIVFVAIPLKVYSSELWGTAGMASFCDILPPADDRVIRSMFNNYLPIIRREGIDLRQAKIAKSKDFMPLLSRAINLDWGPLEFFSTAEFADKGPCVLLLDRQTLLQINEKYDLHALWMISAPMAGQKNIDMELLLLGQGKLIVVYPRQAIVKVKDYDLWTGKYTYSPFTIMDIINNRQTRGLLTIKTLDRPDSEWRPFHGPFDADIHSLELDDEGAIRVKYFKFTETTDRIPKIPISLR